MSVSDPVRNSWIHSYSLFPALLYHQVHVVILQDGDHLYLHDTCARMRTAARDASGNLHDRHCSALLSVACSSKYITFTVQNIDSELWQHNSRFRPYIYHSIIKLNTFRSFDIKNKVKEKTFFKNRTVPEGNKSLKAVYLCPAVFLCSQNRKLSREYQHHIVADILIEPESFTYNGLLDWQLVPPQFLFNYDDWVTRNILYFSYICR